jgi:hypothetical protein
MLIVFILSVVTPNTYTSNYGRKSYDSGPFSASKPYFINGFKCFNDLIYRSWPKVFSYIGFQRYIFLTQICVFLEETSTPIEKSGSLTKTGNNSIKKLK